MQLICSECAAEWTLPPKWELEEAICPWCGNTEIAVITEGEA